MRIETDIKLDFKDVLIRPKRSTLSSRKEVNLDRTYQFRNSKLEWTGVPVMAANMDTVGTFEMAVELAKAHVFTCIHKHYSVDDWAAWQATSDGKASAPYVAVSTGTGAKDLERVVQVVEKCPDIKHICIDVANGYSQHFVEFVAKCRAQFPNHTLIAGNVVTGEMTEELILSGADIVKVGIGPGSVCTTRKIAGVGYPQLSAVIECADAAHGLGGHVIADGGCTCPGDVAKAFGAGADYVMLGGMFAGHDEGAGQVIEVNGEYFKEFYGMSSDTAMKKHSGGVAEYRASEGKTVKVPYRGPVKNTIQSVLGGLRSACTYVGALTLKEISKRTTFVRCSQTVNQIFSSEKHAPPPKTDDGPAAKKHKTG